MIQFSNKKHKFKHLESQSEHTLSKSFEKQYTFLYAKHLMFKPIIRITGMVTRGVRAGLIYDTD